MDYDEIGLRVGIEVHHSLDTERKLFCSCPTLLKTKDNPDLILERKQRFVAGETGEIDAAAFEETKKGKKIIYEAYKDCNCLVETDEEPPHALNVEALKVTLIIAELFHCRIVDEIQVMRKTIVDGSLPSGFQRTILIGVNGWVQTSQGEVEIEAIALEEDSGRLVASDKESLTFRLDRLGTPEVEVAVGKGIKSPEHAREVAKKIGDTVRSTGKAIVREGSVRQDVNVSIKGGDRVEIKHVPSLSLIPAVIEREITRQQTIIKAGKKVSRDVRKVLPDGSTEFLRPLAGAARMYPETDIIPMATGPLLGWVRKNLPETPEKRLQRDVKKGLSEEMARQMVDSEYFGLFDMVSAKFKVEPALIAGVFVSTLRDLERREGLNVSILAEKDFEELFYLLKGKRLVKEAIPEVLKLKIGNPEIKISDAVKKLGLGGLSDEELAAIIAKKIKENPSQPEGKIVGFVMKDVRGNADPARVIQLTKKMFNSPRQSP